MRSPQGRRGDRKTRPLSLLCHAFLLRGSSGVLAHQTSPKGKSIVPTLGSRFFSIE